jgi:peroxiredoxin
LQRRTPSSRAPLRARFAFAALVVAATPLQGAPAGAAAQAATPAAPDFVLKATDGRNLRLSEFRGDTVVLTFWSSGCGPCRTSLTSLDEVSRKTGTSALGVSLDASPERVASVAAALQLSFPSLVDGRQQVARAYDVAKLPLTLLIDRRGVVRASWSGESVSPAALSAAIASLAQE